MLRLAPITGAVFDASSSVRLFFRCSSWLFVLVGVLEDDDDDPAAVSDDDEGGKGTSSFSP